MGTINRWWNDAPRERFWLESTGREDLGANLHAPEHDDAGRDNWRYTLLREMRDGGIVFHYSKPEKAIVAVSEVAGDVVSHPIVWGARGTVAREKKVQPYERSGILVSLRSFRRIEPALGLEDARTAPS